MPDTKPLVNKVAQSGLLTLDLARLLPPEGAVIELDLAPFLFRGLVLREKEFRQHIDELDPKAYRGKFVALHCSTDALVPHWAYMLVTIALQHEVAGIRLGNQAEVEKHLLLQAIAGLNLDEYRNQRIVVKGCSDRSLPPEAYLEAAKMLAPVAKSLMYGEPCSTVPLFKRK
jgi:hypothetical protein